jgi:hypothetical protein
MKGCQWRMGLSQNCWREGEMLAERLIVSVRSAPLSRTHPLANGFGLGGYSI